MSLPAGAWIGDHTTHLVLLHEELPLATVTMESVVAAVPDVAGAFTRLLLAGSEAATANGAVPVLQEPRRVGYRFGSPEQSVLLIGSLIGTCIQELPPAVQTSLSGCFLAVPLTIGESARTVLREAAANAGLSPVSLIAEPLATAAWAALAAPRPIPEQCTAAVLMEQNDLYTLSLLDRNHDEIALRWCGTATESRRLLEMVAAERAALVLGPGVGEKLPQLHERFPAAGGHEIAQGAALLQAGRLRCVVAPGSRAFWAIQLGPGEYVPVVQVLNGQPARRMIALRSQQEGTQLILAAGLLPPPGSDVGPLWCPATRVALPASDSAWVADLAWDGAAMTIRVCQQHSPAAQPAVTVTLPWM